MSTYDDELRAFTRALFGRTEQNQSGSSRMGEESTQVENHESCNGLVVPGHENVVDFNSKPTELQRWVNKLFNRGTIREYYD